MRYFSSIKYMSSLLKGFLTNTAKSALTDAARGAAQSYGAPQQQPQPQKPSARQLAAQNFQDTFFGRPARPPVQTTQSPAYGTPDPSSSYGAPPAYGATAPGYSVPAPSYGAPPPYGAPSYGAPSPYGASSTAPGYSVPSPSYGAAPPRPAPPGSYDYSPSGPSGPSGTSGASGATRGKHTGCTCTCTEEQRGGMRSVTTKHLRQLAREYSVPGRARMNRTELIGALRSYV